MEVQTAAERGRLSGSHETTSRSAAMPAALPPNWHTATAPDGQEYYFNALTRETSWTAPAPQAAAEPGPASPEPPQSIGPTTASPQPISPAAALQQIPTTSLPRLQQPSTSRPQPTSQPQPTLTTPATVSTVVRRRSSPSSHSSKRQPVQQHRHCGPGCSACVGGLKAECNEMALQMLGGLKGAGRVLEGFEGAGRLLEQAVSDVGCGLLAAASTLVDDLSLRGARQSLCNALGAALAAEAHEAAELAGVDVSRVVLVEGAPHLL